jgi:hypothetical protein
VGPTGSGIYREWNLQGVGPTGTGTYREWDPQG